jgi:transcriptional regulator with XRE-family HTH domain
MRVNSWMKAAEGVLRLAGVSQAYVAGVEGVNRAAFSPYLNGSRKPSAEKVLAMNKAIGDAAKDPSAVAYLDCEAVAAGLLPIASLSAEAVVDGALLALEELGMGALVADWQKRLASKLGAWDEKRIGEFLIALNREHRRLLRARARVPWKEGLDAVGVVLRRFGLGDLMAVTRATRNQIECFRNTVRKELDGVLDPSVSARERHYLENRLFIAALELAAPDNAGSLAEMLAGRKNP